MNEFEDLLFKTAVEHFSTEPMFKRLKLFRSLRSEGIGLENWFQSELIYALLVRGFDVHVKNKQKLGGDIIVDGVVIELKAHANPYNDYFINVFAEHPKAQLYLIMAVFDEDEYEKSLDYYDERGYESKMEELDEYWILLMIMKKEGLA